MLKKICKIILGVAMLALAGCADNRAVETVKNSTFSSPHMKQIANDYLINKVKTERIAQVFKKNPLIKSVKWRSKKLEDGMIEVVATCKGDETKMPEVPIFGYFVRAYKPSYIFRLPKDYSNVEFCGIKIEFDYDKYETLIRQAADKIKGKDEKGAFLDNANSLKDRIKRTPSNLQMDTKKEEEKDAIEMMLISLFDGDNF